jgi:DNA-binding transcriptional regulator YdaS (Cro superfamily)
LTLSPETCALRANEAALAASNATLGNVRERELRSEAAWLDLARQLQAIQDGRKAIEKDRAAKA